MVYDPTSDPRAVIDDPTVVNAILEQQREEIAAEIEQERRVVSVFTGAGWQVLKKDLYDQLEQANAALKSDEVNTITGVANVRGQIRAFEFFLNDLPQSHIQRLESLQEHLKELSAHPD